MKAKIIFMLSFAACAFSLSGQQSGVYNRGYTAEQNLSIVGSAAPYDPWGMMGYDNRYSGLVGSRLVYDTLCKALFRFRDDDQWVKLEADMDVVDNILIFRHPTSRDLLSIPAAMVGELVFTVSGREATYRTTRGMKFEKEEQDVRFCQILNDAPYWFIKIPYREFVEADYRALYSAQRTYDEYVPKQRYYVMGSDSVYYKVSLRKKSLIKLFPSEKEVLASAPDEPAEGQSEEDYFTGLVVLLGRK